MPAKKRQRLSFPSGSELLKCLLGRLVYAEMFERQKVTRIIFIDEIDAVGRRAARAWVVAMMSEQTLNQLWLKWTDSTATKASSSLH